MSLYRVPPLTHLYRPHTDTLFLVERVTLLNPPTLSLLSGPVETTTGLKELKGDLCSHYGRLNKSTNIFQSVQISSRVDQYIR